MSDRDISCGEPDLRNALVKTRFVLKGSGVFPREKLGQVGRVLGMIQPHDHGASDEDPFWFVVFANGSSDAFWTEELTVVADGTQSDPLPTCEDEEDLDDWRAYPRVSVPGAWR